MIFVVNLAEQHWKCKYNYQSGIAISGAGPCGIGGLGAGRSGCGRVGLGVPAVGSGLLGRLFGETYIIFESLEMCFMCVFANFCVPTGCGLVGRGEGGAGCAGRWGFLPGGFTGGCGPVTEKDYWSCPQFILVVLLLPFGGRAGGPAGGTAGGLPPGGRTDGLAGGFTPPGGISGCGNSPPPKILSIQYPIEKQSVSNTTYLALELAYDPWDALRRVAESAAELAAYVSVALQSNRP